MAAWQLLLQYALLLLAILAFSAIVIIPDVIAYFFFGRPGGGRLRASIGLGLTGLVLICVTLGLWVLMSDRVFVVAMTCIVSVIIIIILMVLGVRIWRLPPSSEQGERLCRHCGYDLRATPNRCPECGTEAAKSKHQGI